MELGEMISNSLKFPLNNLNRFAGLFLLTLGSILIIPIFLRFGYLIRIIENTTHGKNELPPFVEWGKMFVDGLKFLATTIIYYILPLALLLTPVYMINILSPTLAIILIIIGLVVLFILNLVYVTALNNMAYTGEFKSIFDFEKILAIIGEMGWITYFGHLLAAGIVALIFIVLSEAVSLLKYYGFIGALIGGLASILIGSYVSIYQYRFIGLLFNKMNKFETSEDDSDQEIENVTLGEVEPRPP